MDADAISRLDYAVAECREASSEVLASLTKAVIENYHSIMIPNCRTSLHLRRATGYYPSRSDRVLPHEIGDT